MVVLFVVIWVLVGLVISSMLFSRIHELLMDSVFIDWNEQLLFFIFHQSVLFLPCFRTVIFCHGKFSVKFYNMEVLGFNFKVFMAMLLLETNWGGWGFCVIRVAWIWLITFDFFIIARITRFTTRACSVVIVSIIFFFSFIQRCWIFFFIVGIGDISCMGVLLHRNCNAC